MNKLKIPFIVIVSLVLLFYIFFLFVLPHILDSNYIKNSINNLAKENAGVELKIDKIKVLTSLPLKAGVELNGATIVCHNKQNISLKSVSTKINLLHLLFKKISISNIDAEGLDLSSDISQNGELSLMQCFVFPENNDANKTEENKNDFMLADNLPDINLNNIKLSLFDKETKNKLSLNIDKLKADKIVLNKHFRVNTVGSVLLNNNKNIGFNLRADSFLPDFTQSKKNEQQTSEYFNFIKEFAKYNILSDIEADLKIVEKDKKMQIDGFVNIDDLSFKTGNLQLPKSYIHTVFKKNNADIESKFYISDKEKLDLTSHFNNSKNWKLDVNLITEKISFGNIQKVAIEILSTLNIKNDLNKIKANGYLVSDLKISINPKKVDSNGYLKIINGELISNSTGLYVKDFNSYINCINNTINVENTSLKVNDAKIIAKGTIDEKTNANLEISTSKLPVAKLADAFLMGDLKNNYKIKSGLLDLTVLIQGKLNSIKPSVKLLLSSLNIYDKINNIELKNEKIIADILTDGKKFSGGITLSNTKALLSNFAANLNMPILNINIDTDKIDIKNSKILLNSSQFNLVGYIINYLKKPEIMLSVDGNILANDIKNFIPKDAKSLVKAKGSLPVKIKVSGQNDINIRSQVFANQNNNVDFITIDKLKNNNSIINMNINLKDNNINIHDIGVYTSNKTSLTNDLESNLVNANEVIKLTGSIVNFDTLKNIKADINDTLGLSMMNISTKLAGNLSVSGNINKPQIRGNLSFSNLNAPDYLIKNQTTNINITPSTITAQIFGLDLNGDKLDADAVIKNDFNMPYKITKANIHSNSLDLDKLLVVVSKIAPPSSAAAADANALLLPVKVEQGKWIMDKFKLSTIEASNANTDFTVYNDILDLKNITSTAYKGSLTGDIKYDLKKLLMTAKLKGNNMDANPAVASLIGIKDQIMGTLKFDADISLSGATFEEQLSTLKGTAKFDVKDGQLGSLGKFETYLRAANIMSMQIVKTSINVIISTLLPYNSGQISTATGNLSFNNGYIYFSPVKTSGKEMSLFVTGKMNMLNYTGDIKILGRVSDKITEALGVLGNLSVDKILKKVSILGAISEELLKTFNETAVQSDIDNIPKLSSTDSSKTFRVVLNGNLLSANGVKSFKWLTTEEKLNSTEEEIKKQYSLADTKEELLNEVKESIESKKQQIIDEAQKLRERNITNMQQKTQQASKELTDKINNNQTFKNIKTFGDFIQKKVEEQKTTVEQKTTEEQSKSSE